MMLMLKVSLLMLAKLEHKEESLFTPIKYQGTNLVFFKLWCISMFVSISNSWDFLPADQFY